jgi:hypothetical protein
MSFETIRQGGDEKVPKKLAEATALGSAIQEMGKKS